MEYYENGDMMIYGIRTVVGREENVISMLASKIKREGYNIKAMFHPDKLKGYAFVEGEEEDIRRALYGIRHVKGFISKPVKIEELRHFLEAKKIEINMKRGDIIEIIGGPFKGEKGKVIRIDEAKSEVSTELLEAAVPILITVGIDSVRVLERKKNG